MNIYHPRVSVLDPLGPAIEHVKTVLFRPFDLQRWLAIGFCAWLAELGSGGGGNSGLKINKGGPGDGFNPEHIRQILNEAWIYITANAHWLIPVVCLGAAISLIVGLLVLWLSSRGQFMLLYNTVYNTAEVKRPWHMFREYGHSVFLFLICFRLIGFLLSVASMGGGVLVVVTTWSAMGSQALLHLIWIIPLLLLLLITLVLIESLTKDFVIPLMVKRTTYCLPAWREFKALMFDNLGRFILYALFKFMLGVIIGLVIIFLSIMTCCCSFFLLGLPFVGTVILLPLHVFNRAYPLHYLRQYGASYDLLAPNPSAPV